MDKLNQIKGRNPEEWSNFWYDKANQESTHRILMVGDSTSRQVRRTLSDKTGFPVDLFATSSSLRDQMFWNQLECYFAGIKYNYDVIYIWIGVHSRTKFDGVTWWDDEDFNAYHDDYVELVRFLSNYCENIVLVSAFTFVKPQIENIILSEIRLLLKWKKKEIEDVENTIIVKKKNEIVRKIAEELKLPYCDITSIMTQSGYWHSDHIHYVRLANNYMCDILLKYSNI